MLKSGDAKTYNKTIEQMLLEVAGLVNSVVELSWYMRGGLQYHDALNLTPGERDSIRSFIDRRMESIKDHSFPVY